MSRVSKRPDERGTLQVAALRHRLSELGGDFETLGRRVGVDRTELGRWINGRRPIPAKHVDAVDLALADARGDRRGARRPVYVLGVISSTAGGWGPVFDEDERLGYFDWNGRGLARDTAAMLEAATWEGLWAAPCWPSYLERNRDEGHEPLWLDERVHNGAGDTDAERECDTVLRILTFAASARRQGEVAAGRLETKTGRLDERRPVENTNP